jgi:hypothetical protein
MELSMEFGERWSDPNECRADADCTLVQREVRCEKGASFTYCPIAAHVDSVQEAQSALQNAADAVCPRAPADCRVASSCLEGLAVCDEGRCVTESEMP